MKWNELLMQTTPWLDLESSVCSEKFSLKISHINMPNSMSHSGKKSRNGRKTNGSRGIVNAEGSVASGFIGN